MRLVFGVALLANNSPEPQELRTDFDPGAAGGADVYSEADLIVFHVKINDAALFGEAVDVADGQHTLVLERRHYFGKSLGFRQRNKQNVAPAQIAELAGPFDNKPAAGDGLVFHRLVQGGSERIVAKHADHNGRLRRLKAVARPFDKLSKIEQISRLERILRRLDHLSRRARHPENPKPNQDWQPTSPERNQCPPE